MNLMLTALSLVAAQVPGATPCPEPALTGAWTAWPAPAPAGRTLILGRAARVAEGEGFAASFEVERAGTYEIGLSNAGWIDLVRDGQALASAAHRHGPPCSGIRKIVSFALTPGNYTLRLSRAAGAATVLIVPAP